MSFHVRYVKKKCCLHKTSTMSYFSSETIALLSSFARLGQCIQGVIDRARSSVSHFSTGNLNFQEVTDRSMYTTYSVSAMRILKAADVLEGNHGMLVDGNFVIRGMFEPNKKHFDSQTQIIVGMCYIVEGSEFIPEEVRTGDGVYLVILPIEDANSASDENLITFGTQNSKSGLAPSATYLKSALDLKLTKIVVACCNGAYVVRIEDPEKFGKLQHVYENLMNLQFVCSAPSNRDINNIIYRISANAIFIGNQSHVASVAEIQAILKTNANNVGFLKTSSKFVFTEGIIDFKAINNEGREIENALRTVLGKSSKIQKEPLVKWQTPPQVMSFKIKITEVAVNSFVNPDVSEAAVDISDNFLLLDGRVGVQVSIQSVRIRDPLPGETTTSPQTQLQRAVTTTVKDAVQSRHSNIASIKDDQINFSQRIGDRLRDDLQKTGLYEGQVKVEISFNPISLIGEEIALPDGMITLLPEYARQVHSPRISLITEASRAIGLNISFTSWESAFLNGIKND